MISRYLRITGKAGAQPVISRFRRAPLRSHDDLMALGRLAFDLWMAGVVLSLASIGVFGVFGAVASLLTVARARRQDRLPRDLGQLSRWYPVTELAAIDEALDRILAEEHGALPGPRSE